MSDMLLDRQYRAQPGKLRFVSFYGRAFKGNDRFLFQESVKKNIPARTEGPDGQFSQEDPEIFKA